MPRVSRLKPKGTGNTRDLYETRQLYDPAYTYAQHMKDKMTTEKELQKQVQELADKHGVIWHHCSSAHLCTGQNGLPDLLLLGRCRLAWAELKTSQGYLKSAQNEYRYRLLAAGQTWFLWTPRDLHFGIVEANLRALNEPDGQELGTDYDVLTRNSLLNLPESDSGAFSAPESPVS